MTTSNKIARADWMALSKRKQRAAKRRAA